MRYRLLAAHFTNDTTLEAGTIVGRGPGVVRWHGPPSDQMKPLDEEARVEFDKMWEWNAKEEKYIRKGAGL